MLFILGSLLLLLVDSDHQDPQSKYPDIKSVVFDGKLKIFVMRDDHHNEFTIRKVVEAMPHLIRSQQCEITYKDALSELIGGDLTVLSLFCGKAILPHVPENCIEATVGNDVHLHRNAAVNFDQERRQIQITGISCISRTLSYRIHNRSCVSDNGSGMTSDIMQTASNLGGSFRSGEVSRVGVHLTGQLGKYGVGKQAGYKFSGDAANSKILKMSKRADGKRVSVAYNDQHEFEVENKLFTDLSFGRSVGEVGKWETKYLEDMDVAEGENPFAEHERSEQFTNVFIGNVCDEFWDEWARRRQEYLSHFSLK